MSRLNQVKQPFKLARWRGRRALAARRWGAAALAHAPVVIGNAMPKSGSHLLIQVLRGLTQIGPFVDPGLPPLTRSADNQNLSDEEVLANITRLQSGDIAYAYLHARSPYLEALAQAGIAAFFIYRDPRDVIVSQVFYAAEMHPGHGMHAYYHSLGSMEERVDAAIRGVNEAGTELSSIRAKYEHYLAWLDQREVCALRFEDLILQREKAIGRILDHLAARGFVPRLERRAAIERLAAAIQPRASGTFRKGQPGEWRQHFTGRNIEHFKQATGDLLPRLGYEKDGLW
jgi:hypothetical protein